jgi:arginase family enzyme
MSKNALENAIRYFGASLDALDTQEALLIKKSYVESLSSHNGSIGLRDPYAYFQSIMGRRVREFGHQNLGRFLIETCLTPKPRISDIDLINEESYSEFIRNDGFKVFARLLKDFIKTHVFPHIPGMIGVDHSLTGGVLMALSERFGHENLCAVIFDAHTDAVPLPIRSELVQYAAGAGLPAPRPISVSPAFDPYTAGNFLLYLIEEKIILPPHLIIVGTADGIGKLRGSNDRRAKEYVHHHDFLLDRGVRIIGKDQVERCGFSLVKKALDTVECSNLYLSLDVDVSALCGVLATRFTDVVGTEISTILEATVEIAELLSSNRFTLVGLDVMEIDIHKIGVRLNNGIEDRTGYFVSEFLSILMASLCRRMKGSHAEAGVSQALGG